MFGAIACFLMCLFVICFYVRRSSPDFLRMSHHSQRPRESTSRLKWALRCSAFKDTLNSQNKVKHVCQILFVRYLPLVMLSRETCAISPLPLTFLLLNMNTTQPTTPAAASFSWIFQQGELSLILVILKIADRKSFPGLMRRKCSTF